MSLINKYQQKTAGVVRYSCGILFMLFTFCYLFFLQGEVLAEAQHIFSQGITSYSPAIGALIIPVVLMIVQWIISLLSRLPNKAYSLSYAPSFLILAILADIDSLYDGQVAFDKWLWIAPVFMVLYVILVIVVKKVDFTSDDTDYYYKSILYPNYIILMFFILCLGSVPRTKDIDLYELKTERLIIDRDYAAAAEVGKKSLATSKRLTQLRMYALSKQGLLAEQMFEYPQLYGSAGLLDINDTTMRHRIHSSDICLHLGAFCGSTIKTPARYLEIMISDSLWNKHTADYYLCSLLLDKKLSQFRRDLPRFYNLSDTIPNAYDALPKAYKEALLAISDMDYALQGKIVINGDSIAMLSDTTYASDYKQYEAMKAGLTDLRERINKTHREYGHTYWWYFDFSEMGNGELSANKD